MRARDYPHWAATKTRGGISEPGHVITSLSCGQLCDQIQDWPQWRYYREPALSDDQDEDETEAEDASADDDSGEGFRILSDCRFGALDRPSRKKCAQASVRPWW